MSQFFREGLLQKRNNASLTEILNTLYSSFILQLLPYYCLAFIAITTVYFMRVRQSLSETRYQNT